MAGVLLFVLWTWVDQIELGLLAYGLRAAAFATAGALLGHSIDGLRTAYDREHMMLEASRVSESRYRSLIELLPVVAYRADLDAGGISRYVSSQIEPLLGFEAEDWVADGRRWLERVHPDDRRRVIKLEERSRTRGEPLHGEYRMIASDGHEIWVRDEAVVVEEEGRRMLQGVIHDITDQKRAESVLKERTESITRTVAQRSPLLHDSELDTVYRLAIAAELRDDETHEHTLRVGRTVAILAEAIGLDPEQVQLLARAAPLHDIGKLGVTDEILLKPAPLSPEERQLMRRHVEVGKLILEGGDSPLMNLGAEIAHTHHERWDGTGYPRGLAEEEIPLGGRLTALADAFDVMTHRRPYKEAWPIAHALAEIRLNAATQFDPGLVEAFEELDHEALLHPVRSTNGDPAAILRDAPAETSLLSLQRQSP